MSQETIINIKCDGENCTHVRSKDSNHWLVGVVTQHMGIEGNLGSGRKTYKPEGMTLYMSSKRELLPIGLEQDPNVKDFCGEECAIKWVSKMLTEIKG